MAFWGGHKQQPADKNSTFPPPTPIVSVRQPTGFETVLGASAVLRGELRSQGNVRLDGTFEGTLEIDGNVLVGETAKITADINAKNVAIAGAVRGNVSGKKVQLLRTARVWGDITASAISTEEGAFIEGKITMITHEAAQDFDPNIIPPPEIEPPPIGAEEAPTSEAQETAPPPEAPSADTAAPDAPPSAEQP